MGTSLFEIPIQQEGRKQGIHQVAKNMLVKGLDDDIVTETNGLTSDVIKKLKEAM